MDFVPFTLFFVVCLFVLEHGVMGKPSIMTQPSIKPLIKNSNWPAKCKDKYYCRELIKPKGYPSDDILKELFHKNKNEDKFADIIRLQYNATENRISNICKDDSYMVDKVTMIIDEDDMIRYALYIPGTFEHSTMTRRCKTYANPSRDQEYKDQGIVCVQKTIKYPYIVLTENMEDLETANIKELYSSCTEVKKNSG